MKDVTGKKSKTKKENTHESHRLYSTWKSMKVRCNNSNSKTYKNYGGRGIRVCDRWNASFTNFITDMEESYEEGLTLDRIDNNGNYEPSNCRWATREEQSSNKGNNVKISYKGVEYTEAQLARLTGVKRTTIQQRRNSGYSGDEIVTGKPSKKPVYEGKEWTIKDLAIRFGIKPLTLAYRLRVGYTVESALKYKK